jgi:ABC-type multidrug transport system ATPase subunit
VGGTTLVTRPEPQPIVALHGFGKRYGRTSAVEECSISILRGEVYGLIGPDGAGKSSIMKAVAGVLTFDAGSVEVFGTSLDSERAAEAIKARIGFMPQGLGLNLYPELSVEENINYFARLRSVPPKTLAERMQHWLVKTRLEPFRARPMKHLSGGMKQKLGLICTLIHEPELLILDEPTTGVDPVSRRDFWAILTELLQQRSVTALISTAYMEEASRFQRLALLHQGKILAEGEPAQLQACTGGTLVTLHATPQAEALTRLKTRFPQAEPQGDRLRVYVPADASEAAQCVQQTLAGLDIAALSTGDPELEDVFIALSASPEAANAKSSLAGTADVAPRTHKTRPDIEAKDLSRSFGAFRAVDQVSFRVNDGEIFGLLGANGAGKTTVIKMLTGILRPTSGQGQIAGVDMYRAGKELKKRIGYMSQAFSLYQDLTVQENVRLYAGIYGLSKAETRRQEEWVLALGGLTGYENHLCGSLPMGLRQRLALGCALMHHPEVLFLDEPTSGVDPVGRRRFWEILFHLARQQGVAVLITTHYMSEAEHCDRVALMHAGKIVADAPPDELKCQIEAEAGQLLEISTAQPLLAMEQLAQSGFAEVALFGSHIHLLSPHREQDTERIRHVLTREGLEVHAITPRPLSMEDVFVYKVTSLERQEQTAKKKGAE